MMQSDVPTSRKDSSSFFHLNFQNGSRVYGVQTPMILSVYSQE